MGIQSLLKIPLARIILFFDQRLRFISIEEARKNQALLSRHCNQNPNLKLWGHSSELDPRAYYGLILVHYGIPPHPAIFEKEKMRELLSHHKLFVRVGARILLRTLLINAFLTKRHWIHEVLTYQLDDLHFLDLGSIDRLGVQSKLKAQSIKVLVEDYEKKILIVIPVYNALDYVKQCLESVLKYRYGAEVLVVDDCSTEIGMGEYLDTLGGNKLITLIRNEKNLGFTRNANIGFEYAKDRSVLLLNSDTVVFPDWIPNMYRDLTSSSNVGSVTALSNAATIYSVPFNSEYDCEPSFSSAMAAWLSEVNEDELPPIEIPTCHGFCVLISSEAISKVGHFDVETFGRGYGEENDFSMRLIVSGFKNLLSLKTLVHHFGSKSFGQTDTSIQSDNFKALLLKHPRYLELVNLWLADKNLDLVRFFLFSKMLQHKSADAQLNVIHSLGGGVLSSTNYENRPNVVQVNVSPERYRFVNVQIKYLDYNFETTLIVYLDRNFWDWLAKKLNVSKIIVQHTLGFDQELVDQLQISDAKKVLRIHDFVYICPRIHLQGTDNRDCKSPAEIECNQCLGSSLPEIIQYRMLHKGLVQSADQITAPSEYAREIYKKHFPEKNIEVKYFDIFREKIEIPQLDSRGSFIVGIIGIINYAKGYKLIQEISNELKRTGIKIEIYLYGEFASGLDNNLHNVKVLGRYKDNADLVDKVMKFPPNIIFFPSKVPETYSYALSEALQFKLPIMHFDTGAISERLQNEVYRIQLDLDLEAVEIVAKLIELAKG
jgi:GT2 family glycosyltransferase